MATMIFMVFLTVTLAAIVVATAWSAVKDAERASAEESAKDAVPVPAPWVPETLEGVLAQQLLAGEITGPQYQRAVHKLAERDADRHPMSMPSED
jgi:uncharacterized membrane protein